jgi:hypothetical protein
VSTCRGPSAKAPFNPLRPTIEPINQTLKRHLGRNRHRGNAPAGVVVRVPQCVLALTAAIQHNDKTGASVLRSRTADER